MGWNDKIKLYQNSKGKMIFGTKGGVENSGDDPDVSKPVKKKSSTRKYICPKCGLSVCATKVVKIACMDCGNIQMEEENEKNCELSTGG